MMAPNKESFDIPEKPNKDMFEKKPQPQTHIAAQNSNQEEIKKKLESNNRQVPTTDFDDGREQLTRSR